MAEPRTIHVHYYALLREERGLNQETVQTKAATASELYQELKEKHHLKLSINLLKIAVNNEFTDWQRKLNAGDTVVFLPPVAGG